ncbi:MAG: DUF262 domain-containing protein [Rhodospirillaceae bacterium]|nr:DUF262 domain-containing protein [Rhodospirillaceae bacterium]
MKAEAEESIRSLELTVRFIVTDYSVEFLTAKLRSEEYYVPAYQREMVWDEAVQSRFVESVLIGLPIPFVFLWQDDEGRMEIVDGSQRMRTLRMFTDNELTLTSLELLPDLNCFRFQDLSVARQRKFNARTLRGIVLENATTTATRTEMFARINTGGRSANDAEVRRGSLPGQFTDLVIECARQPAFERLTPISQRLIKAREREELVVRFFTFLESYNVLETNLPNWKDRPREYIFEFVESANDKAVEDPVFIPRLRGEFDKMVAFVGTAFPHGFLKTPTGKQIPRARYEAISVGSGLAIRSRPELTEPPLVAVNWTNDESFRRVTTSDAANVRSKVIGRIEYVRQRLLDQ